MATKKSEPDEKAPRKSQKVNVWLLPEHIEWLKKDKDGASAAVRALIMEAMNMENLARSVKKKKK
jgi:hypothetical protein